MTDKDLLRKVSQLGFPMMEADEALDVNQTLARVVQSREMRLWEGFAVLLANALEENRFQPDEVKRHLSQAQDREAFQKLQWLALALFKLFGVETDWSRGQWKAFPQKDTVFVNGLRDKLARGEDLELCGEEFSAARLKDKFELYFHRKAEKKKAFGSMLYEMYLEHALSQVFSPKQKELFYKKLYNEKMTKTEREYYSRAVKRKVQALANDALHGLARKVLGNG